MILHKNLHKKSCMNPTEGACHEHADRTKQSVSIHRFILHPQQRLNLEDGLVVVMNKPVQWISSKCTIILGCRGERQQTFACSFLFFLALFLSFKGWKWRNGNALGSTGEVPPHILWEVLVSGSTASAFLPALGSRATVNQETKL